MDPLPKAPHYRVLIRQIIEQHAPHDTPRIPDEFNPQLLLDDEQEFLNLP